MKRRFLFLLIAAMVMSLHAANTVTNRTTQITSTVTVSTATDYTISAATPFSTRGSLNITNTDHAVVIFKSIKPSVVKSNWLKYIKINNQAAVDGTNCQVKLYNTGTIILPYGNSTKPLTCYTEPNYQGTQSNNYDLGHNNGYMRTLTEAQLNNNIRSFKLKRGYMVTFAVGNDGWGYSRCFIADKEDLEMATLPAVLNGKISSYRIFKWYDSQKKGVSGDSGTDITGATNSTWTFTWSAGDNRLPDVEMVPHKIHKDWPGNGEIGQKDYSPHAKTDNEPANSADDNPCTPAEALGYWEDLMRTGKRLCSPSTYDGSPNAAWFSEFFNAIDSRGWRCDIYDVHAYWTSVDNIVNYYNQYKRPIWISEMCWGASWNRNGIFAVSDPGSNSSANQTSLYNGAKPMVDKLNTLGYVERYAWWNAENVASKLYYNGTLTTFGKYYAGMDSGLAFNRTYEYVPNVVISTPNNFKVNVPMKDGIVLQWEDSNGDMLDEILVQYRKNGTTEWQTLKTVTPQDKTNKGNQSYTFASKITDAEDYAYRVVNVFDGQQYASSTFSFTVQAEWITSMPGSPQDYYYFIYSKEAKTDLVWAVKNNEVYYQTPAAKYGDNLNQIWSIEPNSFGGYSLRNMGTPSFLVYSNNSWDFNTNNATYAVSAAKTTYLPEYNTAGDYWTMRNVAHSTYVGLWDSDKNFGDGERLAGNRTNRDSGNDSADKLRIYAIPRSELNDVISSGTNTGEWTNNKGYYFYNVESGMFLCAGNAWGTQASLGVEGPMWNVSSGTTGTYRLSRNGTNNYLAVIDNRNEAWVDRPNTDHSNFNITTDANGISTITIATNDATFGTGKLGVTYLGWNGTVGNTVMNPTLTGASPNGIHWILMDALAYAQYAGTVSTANAARQAMWPLVVQAQAEGKGATQVAIYMNPASTKAQLEEANQQLAEILGGVADLRFKPATTYHLYNLESGMFLNQGGDFGTQATLKSESTGWYITSSGEGLWRLSRKGQSNFLYAGNPLRLYVDGATNCDFQIIEDADGIATISIDPANATYGTSAYGSTAIGWSTEYDMATLMPCVTGNEYIRPGTKWMIMDDFMYALNLDDIRALTAAKKELNPLIRAALNNGLDASAAIAVNTKLDATVAQLQEASADLKAKLNSTSLTDYTHLIAGADCGSAEHEGWDKESTWASNITYYKNGESYFLGRFFESWVASDGALTNRTLSQQINGLPNGRYQLSADVIATRQNDASLTVTGINLFLGTEKQACSTANGAPETITTPIFTVTDGTATIGIEVSGTNANWLAFDNFRLIAIPLIGDVNRDGKVSLSDLTKLVAMLVTGPVSDPAADVNGDTVIDARDATALADMILHQ